MAIGRCVKSMLGEATDKHTVVQIHLMFRQMLFESRLYSKVAIAIVSGWLHSVA